MDRTDAQTIREFQELSRDAAYMGMSLVAQNGAIKALTDNGQVVVSSPSLDMIIGFLSALRLVKRGAINMGGEVTAGASDHVHCAVGLVVTTKRPTP